MTHRKVKQIQETGLQNIRSRKISARGSSGNYEKITGGNKLGFLKGNKESQRDGGSVQLSLGGVERSKGGGSKKGATEQPERMSAMGGQCGGKGLLNLVGRSGGTRVRRRGQGDSRKAEWPGVQYLLTGETGEDWGEDRQEQM